MEGCGVLWWWEGSPGNDGQKERKDVTVWANVILDE